MKKIPTVHELRKRGWKVRVGHHRQFYRYDAQTGKRREKILLFKDQVDSYPDYYLSSKGGFTEVTIRVPDVDHEFVGISNCSLQELYSKKVGTKKAIARAYAEILDGGYIQNVN